MNSPKFPNEKWKTAIWILIAVIAVISFLTIKIIGFMDMAANMD